LEATRLNDAFQTLWDPFRAFGCFRGMYVMADLLGLGRIEPPHPILPLPQEARTCVAAALKNLKDVGDFPP